jgi:hypothetical protein
LKIDIHLLRIASIGHGLIIHGRDGLQ